MKRSFFSTLPLATRRRLLAFRHDGKMRLSTLLILLVSNSFAIAQFSGSGAGTELDPYQITNPTQLDEVRNDMTAYYQLMNDIDLAFDTSDPAGLFWNEGKGWEPIGQRATSEDAFSGQLDGNGFAISGLTINRATEDYIGLIGSMWEATGIVDLAVTNVDITGNESVGAIIGQVLGSSILNCHTSGQVEGSVYVGGLIGLISMENTISGSYSTCTVIGATESTGGFAGHADTGYIDINNCYATGNVTGVSRVGGFIGMKFSGGNDDDIITNCYATGVIVGNSDTGGFIGKSSETAPNCYWNTTTSNVAVSASGIGLSDTEAKDQSSFTGWDFVNTWEMKEGFSYPFLKENAQIPNPGLEYIAMTNGAVSACGSIFTDSGGDDANYLNSENYVLTFEPSAVGEKVRVTFNAFFVSIGDDYLRIYDGADTDAPELAVLHGNLNSNLPGPYTATNPEGKLTFKFTSDADFLTQPGWEAAISCVLVPPATPAPVTFTAITSTSVVVNWTAPDDNESEITSYTLAQKMGVGGGYSEVYTGPNLTYPATGLTTGETYYYKVKATNAGGDSEYSDEAQVVPENIVTMSDATITTCAAKFLDPGGSDDYGNSLHYETTFEPETPGEKISVSFSAFSLENSADFLTIYNGPSSASPILATLTGTSLPGSYTATGASGKMTFKFTSDGSLGFAGWVASIACVSIPAEAPSTPTQVTFDDVTTSSVVVNWEAPDDNGSPITSYTLEQKEGSGNFTSVYTGTELTYEPASLTTGATYFYRVSATNGVGTSSPSSENSVLIATAPAVPVLSVSSVSTSAAILQWTEPASNGSSIINYSLEQKTGEDGVYELVYHLNQNSWAVTGLTSGDIYYYRVKASNGIGDSEHSEELRLCVPYIWYRDHDKDGFGIPQGSMLSCDQPEGYVQNYSDCDDTDKAINPETVWYKDNDGDGYGTASVTFTGCLGGGYALNSDDCNDNNININPQTLWHLDTDGDGFGSDNTVLQGCTAPTGYVVPGGDCDDTNIQVRPNTVWFPDEDGDGFGTAGETVISCTQPEGYVTNSNDCDDSNIGVYPGAAGLPDGLDNDCNGIVDKGTQTLTFGAVPDVVYEEGLLIELLATSTSDQPIIFTSSRSDVNIAGNQLTIHKPGTYAITAHQEGTILFEPSAEIVQTFCIRPPALIIAVSSAGSTSATLSANKQFPETIYSWYLNGEFLRNDDASMEVTLEGLYRLRVFADGCEGELSNELEVTFEPEVETGIGDQTFDILHMYPNPADNTVNLSFESRSNGQVTVTLFSVDGMILQKRVFEKISEKWENTLDLGDTPVGLYFIQVLHNGNGTIKRLIKN
jgi:hypothetical protein